MWHKTKVLYVVSIFALSIGMTIASAQDTRRVDTGANATTTRVDGVDNDGFDLGWIGLAGLAGLIGLMPRDRLDRRDVELKR